MCVVEFGWNVLACMQRKSKIYIFKEHIHIYFCLFECRVLDVLQNLTSNIEMESSAHDWSLSSRNIALLVLRQVQLMASRIHCSLRRSRRHGTSPWLSNRRLTCSRLGNSTENRHLWSEVSGWLCVCLWGSSENRHLWSEVSGWLCVCLWGSSENRHLWSEVTGSVCICLWSRHLWGDVTDSLCVCLWSSSENSHLWGEVCCVFVFEEVQKIDTCGARSLVHCVSVFEAVQKTNSHLWGEVSCVLCAFLWNSSENRHLRREVSGSLCICCWNSSENYFCDMRSAVCVVSVEVKCFLTLETHGKRALEWR